MNKSKLKEIEKQIENERKCLIKTLNINDIIKYYNNSNIIEIKEYRNKTSSDILFNNKDFLRILYIHIYEKLLIPDYKKILIEISKEYPNDYFCIQNVLSINIETDIIIKNINKIFEEILINSINIYEEYIIEYYFEYMETKMYNLESLKIKDDEIQLYPNFSNASPFMFFR